MALVTCARVLDADCPRNENDTLQCLIQLRTPNSREIRRLMRDDVDSQKCHVISWVFQQNFGQTVARLVQLCLLETKDTEGM